ncbi:MAG: biotin synthase BioB [Verrucomicrobia bacterium]|nr:biotin synthase BioB [Verrucomicrobiota bacterium]
MNSASLNRLRKIYRQPFFDLIQRARAVCREHWKNGGVQLCTLLSIKTGGCSEDCAYCAQSVRHSTGVQREKLISVEAVMKAARKAKTGGASRFCMGAAWKGVREDDPRFASVLEIVRRVSVLGLEVCVTLGQLTGTAARALRKAGVTVYNHNIDTSPEFYPNIITTHTFKDRLETIRQVQKAGMSVCCGGIIGMGESEEDRLRMLEALTKFDPPPESVPINCLVPMPDTPLEKQPPVNVFELVRLIAVTRIVLPRARVRLSAGRTRLTREAQALCFFAGANSIFYGDKLLTAKNPGPDEDLILLRELDLLPSSVTARPVPSQFSAKSTRRDVPAIP